MKTYIFCISLLFCVMIFFPCLCLAPEKEEEAPPPDLTISVLNHESGEVAEMDLEKYIGSVVLAEMPASYEVEALKAQAVAARTYAIRKMREKKHDNADICTSSACCCAYIAPESYKEGQEYIDKVFSAADETKGEIMLYDNEPITAVFHAMSAGQTASAKDVWGGDVPYLVSVESPKEVNEEGFESRCILSFTEFRDKLTMHNPALVLSSSGEIGEPSRDPSGYVKAIPIGSLTFTGADIRSVFSLRSTNFYIEKDETSVIFTVKGYGHGVGMSQHGANILAKEGKKYDDILTSYYKGVTISSMN